MTAAATGSPLSVTGIEKRFGDTAVLRGVSVSVDAGTVCALLGPSGSGKTTLLRSIAGLERPDAGAVRVGGRLLSDDHTWVVPEQRRVGMVFQDWALFPQMTVAENVAFGLSRVERRSDRVADVLEMVGLGSYGRRLPGTLSGGQQQRIALARALAPRPDVLLLDEPFSNLDSTLRIQVRTDVHRLLADTGITAVFVTHDQEEAFVLGDVVAVINEGMFEQIGSPAEIYQRPATPWVANFVGEANLLDATVSHGSATTCLGRIPLETGAPPHGDVQVLVRPEHVDIQRGDGGQVELVEYYGHDSVVIIRLAEGPRLRARVVGGGFDRGDRVTASYSGPPAAAYSTATTPA
jgi:iron(III) transport system ATP-binding protein